MKIFTENTKILRHDNNHISQYFKGFMYKLNEEIRVYKNKSDFLVSPSK